MTQGDHMKYIMVLQDGETYTGLDGCAIVAVPDDATPADIEAQLDADNGKDFVLIFSVRMDVPVPVLIGTTAKGSCPLLYPLPS